MLIFLRLIRSILNIYDVMKSMALIGGAGFLGSSLVKRFAINNKTYLICDINIANHTKNIIYLNVEDEDSLEQINDVDTIINLAAVHKDDVRPKSRYGEVNVKGAINVCNLARKRDIKKIIFTSSVAIYGFAPAGTDESGKPNYFNEYGRTKYEAEKIYKKWQAEDPGNRTLVIIRPTVIFGEGNRGNVYNLLKQVASKKFIMLGNGKNYKSMAYVENVAAFVEHSLSFSAGCHIYNYIDKPDYDMNRLISTTRKTLFGNYNVGFRLPTFFGFIIGFFAACVAKISFKSFNISTIRIKKFSSTSKFSSSVNKTGFIPPFSIEEGLLRTLKYEFIDDNCKKRTFDTE